MKIKSLIFGLLIVFASCTKDDITPLGEPVQFEYNVYNHLDHIEFTYLNSSSEIVTVQLTTGNVWVYDGELPAGTILELRTEDIQGTSFTIQFNGKIFYSYNSPVLTQELY